MKYDTVIFDMDGTILYTLDDLTDAVNYAMVKVGLKLRAVEEIRGFVGNGIKKLVERCMPENYSKELFERAYEYFSEYYKEHCYDKTRVYGGVNELIDELRGKGIKTAVVSNKDDYGVKTLCEVFFKGLFDSQKGVRENLAKKPAPDLCEDALKELKSEKKNAVYVGDSDVDFLTAKNSGLDFIGVSWGFKGREFLKNLGAENIADTPSEVKAFIFGDENV